MTDKVQKIREEVEKRFEQIKNSVRESDSGAFYQLKELLEFIDSLQEEPVSEKKCMFTKDNYTDEDRKVLCEDCKEKCEYNKKGEPVSGLDNGDMPVERWEQAVKAASNQRNYRSSKGLTETRDDYFVDGVQWADEHPKEEPVSKDKFTFTSLPRLLDRIKPTDRAKWYSSRLADALEKEGYITDAKIVRESIKLVNGEKATMDEESVSKDLEEVAKHYLYSNILYDDVYVGNPTDKDCIEMFKAGANWKKEQMIAKAIDAQCFGFQGAALFSFRLPADNYLVGSEVKVIIIKED